MRARSLVVLAVSLLVAACAGRIPAPVDGPGAITPVAAVERFLQLAAEKRYVEMGWVFGTADGPVIERDPRPDVERRMYALASVLTHDSFVVGAGSPVPGRIGNAVSFRAIVRRGDREFQIPFVTVQGGGDRWFVETVDVEAVTNVR